VIWRVRGKFLRKVCASRFSPYFHFSHVHIIHPSEIPVIRALLMDFFANGCLFSEGRNLAHQFGCQFIETSAKSRINVDNAFYDIVREIRRYNKEMSSYPSGPNGPGGGPLSKIDVDGERKEGGCCGCVVM